MSFDLTLHLPFLISVAACSFIFILSIILLFLLINTFRQSQNNKNIQTSMIPDEMRNITFMVILFFFYSLAEPLVYLSANFDFTKWVTRVELAVSLFAIYFVLKFIFTISNQIDQKPVKIINSIFLGIAIVVSGLMIFTEGLVTENAVSLSDLGWNLEFGPIFFFVYAPILYAVIIFSFIKLISIRKNFQSTNVEKLRYIFIFIGMSILMLSAIIEVLKVFNVVDLNKFGDASVIGITFMSLFLGISTIIKYFNIQSEIQLTEQNLNDIINSIDEIIQKGKGHLSNINDNNLKLQHTVDDILTHGREKFQFSKEAEQQANIQKDNIKNFSTKVIENITTLDSIHSSILSQSNSIGTFFDLINKITEILTDISEKGKVISGGVVNLNSVISDAKVNAKNSYQIMVNISQSVESINYISQTIEKISEDSNILSMNAAIESANKGDIAAGFKVVSDDLRNLSMETTLETDKIYSILHALDKELVQGEAFSQNVEHFFAELEVTVEQIFNFILNIINETKELLSRINTSNEKLLKLQETAEKGSQYSEDQQNLNNQLNDMVIDVKYFIENIRRRSISEKQSIENMLDDAQISKNIIDQIITIENNLQNIIHSVSNRIGSQNEYTDVNLYE